jgi:hypothetical protein
MTASPESKQRSELDEKVSLNFASIIGSHLGETVMDLRKNATWKTR